MKSAMLRSVTVLQVCNFRLCLTGIIAVATKLSNVTHVLRHFSTPCSKDGVVVDVMCHHGQTWIKVIARNSKTLDHDVAGKLIPVAGYTRT
jgi:Family of unknown function (DUF5614)